MTKHHAGQTVRITHSPCRYYDQTATIAEVREDQAHPYRIDTLEPWPLWFGDNELTPTHQPQEAAE